MDDKGGQLRRVGALWRPKPGAKSKGFGNLTIGDRRQKFVILPNRDKEPGGSKPDYVLMSSDEPEVDEYARKKGGGGAPPAADDGEF